MNSNYDNMINTVDKLKTDLALRENNSHIGSRLGGNVAELFFLLTNKVEIESTDGPMSIVSQSNNEIKFKFPNQNKQDIFLLRKTFTNFFNSHPNKNDYTLRDLIDLELLQSIDQSLLSNKDGLQDLIECVSLSLKLKKCLQIKLDVKKTLLILAREEKEEIEQCFCLKTGCSKLDLNKKIKKTIWSEQIFKVKERYDKIISLLLSEEDINLLKTINNFPDPIKLICLRSILTLEIIINLNLDYYITELKYYDKMDRGEDV